MSDAPASVLSDGTILALVDEGRIRIDPWDPALVQPASVDLRLGDSFRVFHNHRASAIDLRDRRRTSPSRSIVPDGRAVRDPPRRVLPRADARVGRAARRHRRPDRGQVESLGRLGLIVHATAGFCDPGLEGHAHARAQQPHPRPDQALSRAADRAAVVHDPRPAGAAPVRQSRARQPLPGPARRDREPLRGRERSTTRGQDQIGSRRVLALFAVAEPSKVPFYIAGGALAVWAVVLPASG